MNGYGIISDNLAALDEKQSGLCEKRLAHITEFAGLMKEAYADSEELFFRSDAFADIYAEFSSTRSAALTNESTPAYNRPALETFSQAQSLFERVYLCEKLDIMLAGSDPMFYFPKDPEEGENVISYLRNYYADAAYLCFSDQLEDAAVTYNDEFSGVCEDVYYNRARLCILPIENSRDGVLTRFRSLMSKFDLKTVMTCDIPMSDGDGSTCFALLKKNVELLPCSDKTAQFFFRFSLPLSGPERGLTTTSVTDILAAASWFGLDLHRIDSVPDAYADGGFSCDIVLEIGNGNLSGFLCFLHLEAPRFTPSGIYYHIYRP